MDLRSGVAAIVLCGGGGSRFGGSDKPLLELSGRPMLDYVLERLEAQVDTVILSANRNRQTYERYGHTVVPDRFPDRGPLAGLVSALPHTEHELLFLCPGDAPLLASDLVARLCCHLTDGVDAVIPHDGERAQHLFTLIRRSAAEDVDDYLDRGGRSVAGFFETRRVRILSVDDESAFVNVNTEADLTAVAQRLSKRWRSTPE